MKKLGGLKLPKGWPDPYGLLRDPEWEKNYPMIVLRGIYDVMERMRTEEEDKKKGAALREKRREALKRAMKGSGKPIPGDYERRYIAGFNITIWKLANAKKPRFKISMIRKGIISKKEISNIYIRIGSPNIITCI